MDTRFTFIRLVSKIKPALLMMFLTMAFMATMAPSSYAVSYTDVPVTTESAGVDSLKSCLGISKVCVENGQNNTYNMSVHSIDDSFKGGVAQYVVRGGKAPRGLTSISSSTTSSLYNRRTPQKVKKTTML